MGAKARIVRKVRNMIGNIVAVYYHDIVNDKYYRLNIWSNNEPVEVTKMEACYGKKPVKVKSIGGPAMERVYKRIRSDIQRYKQASITLPNGGNFYGNDVTYDGVEITVFGQYTGICPEPVEAVLVIESVCEDKIDSYSIEIIR